MSNDNGEESQSSSSRIKEIFGQSEHLLTIAGLFYFVGFAITNLFLGSFGVVNFGILRIRYVLTGLLFGIFIAIIVIPIYGLLNVLRGEISSSTPRKLSRFVQFTIDRYSVYFIAVLAIGVFASTRRTPTLQLPSSSNEFNFVNWFSSGIIEMIKNSFLFLLILLGAAFVSIVLVFLIILLINPKDKSGEKKSRRELIKEFRSDIGVVKDWRDFLKFLAFVFFLVLAVQIVYGLIINISESRVQIEWSISQGWLKYIAIAFLFYLLISSFLLFLFVLPERSTDTSNNNSVMKRDPLNKYYSWIYLSALAILFIVPIYAYYIYPEIPQHLGGGEPVEVQVVALEEISSTLDKDNIIIYLLDRTSEGSIFLLIDEEDKSHSIVEVPESQIGGIIYNLATSTPTSTALPNDLATPMSDPD